MSFCDPGKFTKATLTIEILKVQLLIDPKTKIYDLIDTVCINGVMSIFEFFKRSLVANICQKLFQEWV